MSESTLLDVLTVTVTDSPYAPSGPLSAVLITRATRTTHGYTHTHIHTHTHTRRHTLCVERTGIYSA